MMLMCVFFVDHADLERNDAGAVPAIQIINGYSVCGQLEHVHAVQRHKDWYRALNYVAQRRAEKEALK